MVDLEEIYHDIDNWSIERLQEEQMGISRDFNEGLLDSEKFEEAYGMLNKVLHRKRNKRLAEDNYERAMRGI